MRRRSEIAPLLSLATLAAVGAGEGQAVMAPTKAALTSSTFTKSGGKFGKPIHSMGERKFIGGRAFARRSYNFVRTVFYPRIQSAGRAK